MISKFLDSSPFAEAVSRGVLALGVLLMLSAMTSVVRAQMPSNNVLQALDLGGQNAFIKWTNFTYDNPDLESHSASTATGSIAPIAAFQASSGFYSYTRDFGFTATTATAAFDIQNVVLQSVMMRHPSWNFSDHLAYNHAAHFQAGDGSSTEGDYYYVPELAALNGLVENYAGGPVLTYTLAGGGTGSLTATVAAVITGPMYMQTGAFQGNYYSFAWQWDLTSVVGTVTEVSVTLPIIVHSSTIGAQLDIGDTYTQVVSAVPEPAAYALFLSAAALAVVALKRHRSPSGMRAN